MTNAPERFLSWRFDPNDRNSVPVSYVKDNRKQNCGTFILSKEDHTIGNLVRSRLVEDKNVRFAGYRVPHPLINECHVRIETIDKSNPRQVIFFFSSLSLSLFAHKFSKLHLFRRLLKMR